MSSTKKDLVQISSYSRRLKENVKSILDNYGEILRASKVSDSDPKVTESQVAHVENEIEVRAANIVRAAEALFRLVSELKEYLILNDFSSINETITKKVVDLKSQDSARSQELRALHETKRTSALNTLLP